MGISPLIDRLIGAFQVLPGVGPKGAQRMVLHLLQRDRDGARQLAEALFESLDRVSRCSCCRNLSEEEVCSICGDPRRDDAVLCVVESPAEATMAVRSDSGWGVDATSTPSPSVCRR